MRTRPSLSALSTAKVKMEWDLWHSESYRRPNRKRRLCRRDVKYLLAGRNALELLYIYVYVCLQSNWSAQKSSRLKPT